MIFVDDLSLDTPEGLPVLEGLHLSVEAGANLLLLGASGSGKSQVLRVLAGTLQPRSGKVRIGGVAFWPGEGVLSLAGRLRIGFVAARGGLLSNQTLRSNVALPLRFAGLPEPEVADRTDRALDRFGLGEVADRRPHAVSVCARKRANLARAAALSPDLVLLDEPLEGVEAADVPSVLTLIQAWAADPACTLVLAQEDLGAFAALPARHLHLAALHPLPPESEPR